MPTCFGASIPLAKALSPEVLIAFAMNGEPLTPEHGFPLRVVVPGYIGARSVKWLTAISIEDQPSDNYFQQNDYKLLPVGISADEAERGVGVMLGELPVNSAVLTPLDGAELEAGTVMVRGYAVAGSGRTVGRVDVSADGGATWQKAELRHARRLDVDAVAARASTLSPGRPRSSSAPGIPPRRRSRSGWRRCGTPRAT